MNEFTKKDLALLMRWAQGEIDWYGIEKISEDEIAMFHKLQSMIDNYPECSHESDGLCYTSNPPQNKCKKCGEFYR